jgi:hypothetical protein
MAVSGWSSRREREVLHPLDILSRNTSLSLFYLNHPPTAIGRILAYRSDENFPEKFKSEIFRKIFRKIFHLTSLDGTHNRSENGHGAWVAL